MGAEPSERRSCLSSGMPPSSSTGTEPTAPPLDEAKVRELVAQTPGAELWREGMKLPGQEEREEREAEWMRGEFDPVGDLVVTGMRLARGEGRTAELATGPQPGEWDDVCVELRGSPRAAAAEGLFFASRGAEATLASRGHTSWMVELSDPRLSEHWRRSLRAMSHGIACVASHRV